MKIGILLIATGKYIGFFKQLHDSTEKYMFPEAEKTYFLFTDNTDIILPNNVIRIFQEREDWPGPTLHRYHYFDRIVEIIKSKNLDYIFYSDVDMKAVAEISTNILPKKGLVAVIHPGFYNTNNPRGTPETRPESRAYIAPNIDFKYAAGGLQGGVTNIFLKAIKNMKEAIMDDESRGIIAIWHDESYWQKFVVTNKHIVTFLSPEYCMPENWTNVPHLLGLTHRYLALDKNHCEMRS
jgi:hypothetical protein